MAPRRNNNFGPAGASKDASFFLFLLLSGGIVFFVLWPFLAILRESVFIDGAFSLKHYHDLFTENRVLLKNSLFVSFWTMLAALSIGLCCALYLGRTPFRGKRAVFLVLMLTLISPPFVSSLAYIMLFGKRGLITWKFLGIQWNPYGPHGIIMMESLGFSAIAAFLILAVMRGMDRQLEQASLDLGAGRWGTLRHITLPLAFPGIVTAALIVFIRSLSDFGTPMFVGGNYNVLATQAYMTAVGSFDLSKASAISTLLLIPAFAAFLAYRKLMGGSSLFSRKTSHSRCDGAPLPPLVNGLVFLVTWGFVLIELLKYGTIFFGAFIRTWGVNFSLTLHHMGVLKLAKLDSLLRSVKYSLAAALIAGTMGVVLAWFLGRGKGALIRTADFIADLPFILPGPFFGIAYLLAFQWMPESLLAAGFLIVANCVFRQLSLGVKSGISILGQVNLELEDAVRDQGGKRWYVLKDVIVPLLKPAFFVSFINTFTFTMTTIGGIIFLITPYTKVATAEMFDAIQCGDIGVSSVLASMIILVVMIVNAAFSWIFLERKNGIGETTEESYVSSIKAPQ